MSAAGSEAWFESDPFWLGSSEVSLPAPLGSVVGLGKLGDPVSAGAAVGVVGAGGSVAGVVVGTSDSACCSESGDSAVEESPEPPPGTMPAPVCKAFGGS